MPVIYYNNISIELQEVQRTTPSLKFLVGDQIYYASVSTVAPDDETLHLKSNDGTVYHIVPHIADGTMVYEVPDQTNSMNRCITNTTLQPGTYQVNVKGGRGGDGGGNATNQNSPGFEATERTCEFTLTQATSISVFRGGNGNPGGVGQKSGNATAPAGGGASGGPSAVIINGEICLSEGAQFMIIT